MACTTSVRAVPITYSKEGMPSVPGAARRLDDATLSFTSEILGSFKNF